MDYFELFGIKITFIPSQQQLKQKFYELSRKYHPDFFTRENNDEQTNALEASAQVNKAYKIFQNRDETIKYVLELKGLLEEEEKYQLPPDFLMEMLELNEEIADAKMEENHEKLLKLKKELATIEESIYEPVQLIVEGYEEGAALTDNLLKVKEYYFKKKYLNRILAALR